jgi:branched-chain amino acid transport system ATP-binding protein
MSAPVLEAHGLHKSWGGVAAVDGVSLAVQAGEMLALIGPNGAGKSTCFNMLNGQIRPEAGSVHLLGRDITGLAPRAVWRLGVGRTFQVTATFGSMSVLDNVRMALLSHHRRLFGLWRPAAKQFVAEAEALSPASGWRNRRSGPAACWPMATSSGWNWPSHWPTNHACC